MPISVANSLRGAAQPLRAIVNRALRAEGRRAGEIGIVLADDATLRSLNRQWRGIDRATDVLSFEHDGPPEEPRLAIAPRRRRVRKAISGDLMISMDRVAEQAKRYRVSLGRELARLVVHGALHLAGHDHHRAAERRVMRAKESAALRAAKAEIDRLDRAFARSRQSEGT